MSSASVIQDMFAQEAKQKAARRKAKRKAQEKEDNKGIFDRAGDVISGANRKLGVSNFAKMPFQIAGGLWNMGFMGPVEGTANLLGIKKSNNRQGFGKTTQGLKGFGYGFQQTASIGSAPFAAAMGKLDEMRGGDGYSNEEVWDRVNKVLMPRYEQDKEAGKTPPIDPFWQNEQGLLPALAQDLGNVAAGGFTAAKGLGVGRVGKIATARAARAEATRTGSTAYAHRYAKKMEGKAEPHLRALTPEELARLEPDIARRQKAVRVAEVARHPIRTPFIRYVRPSARAATEKLVGRVGAEAAARTALNKAMDKVRMKQAAGTATLDDVQQTWEAGQEAAAEAGRTGIAPETPLEGPVAAADAGAAPPGPAGPTGPPEPTVRLLVDEDTLPGEKVGSTVSRVPEWATDEQVINMPGPRQGKGRIIEVPASAVPEDDLAFAGAKSWGVMPDGTQDPTYQALLAADVRQNAPLEGPVAAADAGAAPPGPGGPAGAQGGFQWPETPGETTPGAAAQAKWRANLRQTEYHNTRALELEEDLSTNGSRWDEATRAAVEQEIAASRAAAAADTGGPALGVAERIQMARQRIADAEEYAASENPHTAAQGRASLRREQRYLVHLEKMAGKDLRPPTHMDPKVKVEAQRPMDTVAESYAARFPEDATDPSPIRHAGDNPAELPELARQYLEGDDVANTPEAVASYKAFIARNMRQGAHALGGGPETWIPQADGSMLTPNNTRLHFTDGDTYPDAAAMRDDLAGGNLRVRHSGAAKDSPNVHMREPIRRADGSAVRVPVRTATGFRMEVLTQNDLFRAVHDIYGHARANDFGTAGEVTAWRLHDALYPPEAKMALANETIAQTAYLESGGSLDDLQQRVVNLDPKLLDDLRRGGAGEAEDAATGPIVGETKAAIDAELKDTTTPDDVPQMRRLAALANDELPGWSESLVAALPRPVVKGLAGIDRLIRWHDSNVMARELGRMLDSARTEEFHSDRVRLMTREIGKPLVGQRLDTGVTITAEIADQMVGAEVIARIVGTSLRDSFGIIDKSPLVNAAMNRVASKGHRIPPAMIDALGLEPKIQEAVALVRDGSKQKWLDLANSRLGTKGIAPEDVGYILSSKERQLAKRLEREVKNLVKIDRQGDGEVRRATKGIEQARNRMSITLDELAKYRDMDEQARVDINSLYESPNPVDNPVVQRGLPAMVKEVLDKGGSTYDLQTGKTIKPAYAASVTSAITDDGRATLKRVTVEDFRADPTRYLNEALASHDIFKLPWVKLGAWLDSDGWVHIDPSITEWPTDVTRYNASRNPLTRGTSWVVGTAFRQDEVIALKEEGETWKGINTQYDRSTADLATHFVNEALNSRSQFTRYLDELHRMVDDAQNHVPDDPYPLTHAQIDAEMVMEMNQVYAKAKSQGMLNPDGSIPHNVIEAHFKQRNISYNKTKRPDLLIKGNRDRALNQVVLKLDIENQAQVMKMIDVLGPQYAQAIQWYYNSHKAIERYRGRGIILGNGQIIDAADLMHQLVAVSSIQSTPLTNLGNAMNAMANWTTWQATADAAFQSYSKGMDRFLKLPKHEQTMTNLVDTILADVAPKQRLMAEAPQRIGNRRTAAGALKKEKATRTTGIYTNAGDHLKALTAVLSGHTLDLWTADDLMRFNVSWGGAVKSLKKGETINDLLARIPEETLAQAKMEVDSLRGADVQGKGADYWRDLVEAREAAAEADVQRIREHFNTRDTRNLTPEQRVEWQAMWEEHHATYDGSRFTYGRYSTPMENWLSLPDRVIGSSGRMFHSLDGRIQRMAPYVTDMWDEDGPTNSFMADVDQLLDDARQAMEDSRAYDDDVGSGGPLSGVWQDYINHVEDLKQMVTEDARGAVDDTYDMQVARRAVALHTGSDGWAKILSFWENLKDPVNSQAVTLDTWMARAFGMNGWSTPGDYAKFSAKVQRTAAKLGIEPHALQAVIWVYAKQKISQQTMERVWGADSLARSKAKAKDFQYGGADDPILAMLEEDAMPTNNTPTRTKTPLAREQGGRTRKGDAVYLLNSDLAKARDRIHGFTNKKTKKYVPGYLDHAREWNEARARGEDVSGKVAAWTSRHARAVARFEKNADMEGLVRAPNKRLGIGMKETDYPAISPLALDEVIDGLAMEVEGRTVGHVVPGDAARPHIVRLFKGGDFQTLLHENIHVLRQSLKPEHVDAVEDMLEVPRGTMKKRLEDPMFGPVRRKAEEDFVEMMLEYMISGKHENLGMAPILAEIRGNMQDLWNAYSHTREAEWTVNPGLASLWDDLFDPQTSIAEVGTVVGDVAADAPEALLRQAPDDWTPAQVVQRNKALPGETIADALARQKKMGNLLARSRVAQRATVERTRRVAMLQKNLDEFSEIIRHHGSPDTLAKRARTEAKIGTISEKLAERMAHPTTRQVPPVWQPLWEAITTLHKEAEDMPELAAALEGVPKRFDDMLRLAHENGFDPVHVRDFTDKQVAHLIYGSIDIGKPGRRLGQEVTAGTRIRRQTGTPREQSISALSAAHVEVMGEIWTNELVRYLDEYGAVAVPNGGIPKGWKSYEPRRNLILYGEETMPHTKGTHSLEGPTAERMIPAVVDKALERMGRNYHHPILTGLSKLTNPWRTFVLTLNPRWYIHDPIGTVMLAATAGASFKDFRAAWQAYKEEKGGIFDSELQTATGRQIVGGRSIFHDNTSLGAGSSIMPPGKFIPDMVSGKGVKSRWIRAKQTLTHVHDSVNQFSRSAVYHATLRTTGDRMVALQEAHRALVDYGDLTPFERSWVRAVVPFYSWQKGIIKIMARLGYDHPIVFGLMERLAYINAEYQRDEYGTKLPDGYGGVVNVFGQNLNMSPLNPFASAARMFRPDGIAESMNPFLDVMIRSQFGATSFGRPDNYRMNAYGSLVPDVPVMGGVSEILEGLPAVSTIMNATGTAKYETTYSPLDTVARYAGDVRMPDALVKKMVKRTKETQATLDGKPMKKKKKKVTSTTDKFFNKILARSGLK